MAYSERAMKLLTKVIEDYPQRTGPIDHAEDMSHSIGES